MRHRKPQRREFVLQCSCGDEPECIRMEQNNHSEPVYGGGGRTLGVIVGEVTTTLEAECHKCGATITYNIDPTGQPRMTSVETSLTFDRYLGDDP